MIMASTLQGRFKQELALEDVLTGQSFDRPARNLPPHWLVENVLVKVAHQVLYLNSLTLKAIPCGVLHEVYCFDEQLYWPILQYTFLIVVGFPGMYRFSQRLHAATIPVTIFLLKVQRAWMRVWKGMLRPSMQDLALERQES